MGASEGRRLGQGEVLCRRLRDGLRHVLGFQRRLSRGRGRRGLANGRRSSQPGKPPGRGTAGAFAAGRGNGGSSDSGLLWPGYDWASAIFASQGEAGRAFRRRSGVTGSSGGAVSPPPQPWQRGAAQPGGRCGPQRLPRDQAFAMGLASAPPCTTLSISFPLPYLFLFPIYFSS